MDNITPPQISEERITQLWDAIPKSWPPTRASRAAFAQAVAAERDRQWLERLEPAGEVGSMPGTSGFTMAAFKAEHVPLGTQLYRIKEQG